MSKESANQFLEDAARNEALREKLQSAPSPDEFVSTAHSLGYSFTVDELKEVVREHSEDAKLRRKTGIWPWLRTVHWV